MSIVTISTVDFDVYQNVEEATANLVGDLRLGVIWIAGLDDNKKKSLVGATRWIDRQTWKGEAAGSDHAWPRTGATDRYGSGVSSSSVPADVLLAHSIMAALILENASVAEKTDQGVKTKYVKAGPVEVEFFLEAQDGQKFPGFVNDLLGQYLASSSPIARAIKTGDSDATSTSGFGDYSHDRGFY